MPLLVLVATALAIATKYGAPSIYNPGPQGFSETLYAYISQANNNGSAFAGYTGFVQPNAPGNVGAFGITFADLLGGVAMLFGRFVPLIAALAVAGALAAQAGRAGRPRHVAHRHADVRRAADRRDPARRARSPSSPPCCSARSCRASPTSSSDMRRTSINSALAVVVFTVLLGLAYPLLITGVSQVAFPGKADGSQIERDGKVVGSRLIGQDFKGDAALLPVATLGDGYNPPRTFFNNLGPNCGPARPVRARTAAYLPGRGPYNPGLERGDVPADAVQTSASGVDPTSRAPTRASRRAASPRVRGSALDRVLALWTTTPTAARSACSASPASTCSSSTSRSTGGAR